MSRQHDCRSHSVVGSSARDTPPLVDGRCYDDFIDRTGVDGEFSCTCMDFIISTSASPQLFMLARIQLRRSLLSLPIFTRQYAATAMTMSTDAIQSKLFSRTDLPPLEPGTKVYDEGMIKEIAGLKEHKLVIAGGSRWQSCSHPSHLAMS